MLAGRKWQRGDVSSSTDITTLEKCCSCLETRLTLSAYWVEKRPLLLFPSNCSSAFGRRAWMRLWFGSLRQTGRSCLRTLVAVSSEVACGSWERVLLAKSKETAGFLVLRVSSSQALTPAPLARLLARSPVFCSVTRAHCTLWPQAFMPPKLKGMKGARGRDVELQIR